MFQQCLNCGGPAFYSGICSDECGEEFDAYLKAEAVDDPPPRTQADEPDA